MLFNATRLVLAATEQRQRLYLVRRVCLALLSTELFLEPPVSMKTSILCFLLLFFQNTFNIIMFYY